MIRSTGINLKTGLTRHIFRVTVLSCLLLTLAPIIQSQTITCPMTVPHGCKPSDVFFTQSTTSTDQEIGLNNGPAASIVAKDIVLRGWLAWDGDVGGSCGQVSNAVNVNCQPSGIGISDVHYELVLDYDFINSTYGQNAGVLAGAMLPGDPVDSQTTPIPMTDQGNGTPSRIGINSFWLPYAIGIPVQLHTELNAWHTRASSVSFTGSHHFDGRGPAPAGWIEKDYGATSNGSADHWWPFDPDDPDGLTRAVTATTTQPGPDYAKYKSCDYQCSRRGGVNCADSCKKQFPKAFVNVTTTSTVPMNLQVGDYVEMKGTLWQDVGHDAGKPRWCWNQYNHNDDGWLEIHPVDSIKRIFPSPGRSPLDDPTDSAAAGVKRVAAVMLCSDEKGAAGPGSYPAYSVTMCPEGNFNQKPNPDPNGPPIGWPLPSGRTPKQLVPHFLELIDERFSTPQSIGHGVGVNSANPDCVDVITWLTSLPSARFKASYVVSWTPGTPVATRPLSATASIIGQTQSLPLTVALTLTDPSNKRPLPGIKVWVQDGFGRTQSSGMTAADGTVRLPFSPCPQSSGSAYNLPGVPSPACPIYGGSADYYMLKSWTPALAASASVTYGNALSVSVSDPLTKTNAAGATVSVLDHQGRTLASGATAGDGTATLSLANCPERYVGYSRTCQATVIVTKPGYLNCSFAVPAADGKGSCDGSFAGASPLAFVGVAVAPNNTIAGGLHAGTIGQQVQVQLPALAATVSSNGPASSPVTDTITVTSGGAPVAGATITVGASPTVTNANGVAVITHGQCFGPGQVARVGATTVPVRTPIPCGWTATASMAGYQSFSFSLP